MGRGTPNQTTSRRDPAAEMQNKSGTAPVGKRLHCGESRMGNKRRKCKSFGNNPREGQSWRRHFIKAQLRPHPNPSPQNKGFLQLCLAQHIFKIHISCHKSYGTLSPLYFISFFCFLIGPMMPYLYSRSELHHAPGNFPPTVRSGRIQEGSAGGLWTLEEGPSSLGDGHPPGHPLGGTKHLTTSSCLSPSWEPGQGCGATGCSAALAPCRVHGAPEGEGGRCPKTTTTKKKF